MLPIQLAWGFNVILLGSCMFSVSNCLVPMSASRMSRSFDRESVAVSGSLAHPANPKFNRVLPLQNTNKKYLLGMDCGRCFMLRIDSVRIGVEEFC